ncbi:50S ribosomal protein L6 [Methylotuvimicrobium buryatense]|uniref:Large ribosomal subunit protein uL6 n=1 Tax=Methylotuvimicrobium buryatense TaxID=95641 RepID=A0A4P9UKC9_METBY|nr:50S ribosomal protein L6 [Methylotuvimicrobium buryatense]QCW81497.1 50S ribosomal protein L6 [Methylotuvimicrobium buryatense]
MSRIAKVPIALPSGIDIKLEGNEVTVKGTKGQLSAALHEKVSLVIDNSQIEIKWDKGDKIANSQAGTARAVINNMIIGVSQGFEKKLALVGVGYRAQAKGDTLGLSLGFSHPVDYVVPAGITIETPSQTEIIIKGFDKQKVGQVAAEIRAYRPPEPYKGKGVRYADENVVRKEAKKK